MKNKLIIQLEKGKDGMWRTLEGVILARVATIRSDEVFCSKEVWEEILRPNSPVIYYPETISWEKENEGVIVFITIIPLEIPKIKEIKVCHRERLQIPIYMLELVSKQQKELEEKYHVPKKFFEKVKVALPAELREGEIDEQTERPLASF